MPFVTSNLTMMHRANHKGAKRRRTRDAAYRDAARALVLERRPCDCEPPDWDSLGQPCLFHAGRYAKLIERVARLMWRADQREGYRQRIREQQKEVARVLADAQGAGFAVEEVRP